MHELVDRWRACPLTDPPYVLPGDESAHGSRRTFHRYSSFTDFIQSDAFGATGDTSLHLGLLPLPYLGDVTGASIYILLLNPGVCPDDYYAESHHPEYRDTVVRTLRQENRNAKYPFHFLDPRFSWHAGFGWWHGRLRGIVAQWAAARNLRYQDALAEVSRRTCALELMPYHSGSFGSHALLDRLASVRLVRRFVHDVVVPKARAGSATVVVTRRARDWGLEASDNVVVYGGGETRAAHLGPGTRGGTAIMRRLESA